MRLNRGTQTNFDYENALKEVKSSESPAEVANTLKQLLQLNLRKVEDLRNSVLRRRKNAGYGEPELGIVVPQFDVQIINNNDYNAFLKNPKYPSGTPFIDPEGIRRSKP